MKHVPVVLFILFVAGGACGGGPTMRDGTITTTTVPATATLSTINPTSGTAAGGTAVTITGTNFTAGATVTIGGVPLTGITVVSSTSITGATAQSSTAGAATVTVTTNNQPASLPNGFTYLSVPRAVISGAPANTDHDTDVTFDGTGSTTTNPFTISTHRWDCGQDPAIYGSGCTVTNNVRPTFKYRKCINSGSTTPPRPLCTSTDRRTYTVTLTVTDGQNNQNSTTFNITVKNKY